MSGTPDISKNESPSNPEPPRLDPLADTILAARNDLRLKPNINLACSQFTSVGQKRKQNQDSLLTMQTVKVNLSDSAPLGLYVVADGMGGQASGEVASGIVVSTLAQYAHSALFSRFLGGNLSDRDVTNWLRTSIEAANVAVLEGRTDRANDMGSTVVAIVVKGNMAHIAHVGDSRAYRLDADGQLERLTMDHSLVEQLVQAKQITPEEARTHRRRNVVYRTVGDKESVEIDVTSIEVNPGDKLVLCSDGLNSMIPDSRITAVVRESPSLSEAARNLADAANVAGGDDNITVVLVEIASL